MTHRKYETLLDPALLTYIARVNSWFPPELAGHPIQRQRAAYNAMCRAFHTGRPEGVLTNDDTIDAADHNIPIRRYTMQGVAPRAAIIYYHGGGFVFGGLDSHDDVCAELCAASGFDVLSVDYRLAPEHLHPAAFEDARAGFERATATIDLPIVLCGESAGGNLAAAVAHASRDNPRRAIGQVLIYPGLGGDAHGGSSVEHADAPLLTSAEVEFYRRVRTGNLAPQSDPTLEPLCDNDFSGLPPTVVVTAECDPLSADGETYRDRIVAAGGRAWCRREPRLVHSFLRARTTVPAAREAFSRIVDAVTSLGSGEWPY
jgi:acetyl esterase